MSLIKINDRFPWNNSMLSNFLNTDDFFNDDFFAKDGLMPAMNVLEHDKDFEVEIAAPGFNKDDFNITVDGNGLHIGAEKEQKEEIEEEGYLRKEFSYNSFKRSLRLPESVNTVDDFKATYKNGVLKLTLPKLENMDTKKEKVIKVK